MPPPPHTKPCAPHFTEAHLKHPLLPAAIKSEDLIREPDARAAVALPELLLCAVDCRDPVLRTRGRAAVRQADTSTAGHRRVQSGAGTPRSKGEGLGEAGGQVKGREPGQGTPLFKGVLLCAHRFPTKRVLAGAPREYVSRAAPREYVSREPPS
eukprot:205663-Chlamydomonas_euryale.AAC.8